MPMHPVTAKDAFGIMNARNGDSRLQASGRETGREAELGFGGPRVGAVFGFWGNGLYLVVKNVKFRWRFMI
jgi:hypothetical protein